MTGRILISTLKVKDITLRNRIDVSPMPIQFRGRAVERLAPRASRLACHWRNGIVTLKCSAGVQRLKHGPFAGLARRGKHQQRRIIMKHDVYDNGATATTATRRPGSESKGGQSDADKQEMMRKVEEAGKPGPGHKALEHYVGNWKCDVKCWMDPKGQPEQSQGTSKMSWIMGGRYLQEEFQGQMMGRPFNGRVVLTFNSVKQTYQSVWFDDMNLALFMTEGRGDSKGITLEGKSSCPVTGQTDIPMKIVLRVLSPDKHTFEMFDGSQGNAKTMEITYTRQ
jgi:hypothetical protein